MRNLLIICLLTLLLAPKAWGQYSELGGSVGLSYYLGDMNQKHFANAQPMLGLTFRKSYQKKIAYSIFAHATYLRGADSLSSDPAIVNRNLNFRTPLYELGGCFEMNYFDFQKGSRFDWITPYLFVGISVFYINPQGYNGNEWVDLQPIGTEGQIVDGGKKYNLVNFALPFGTGLKITGGKFFSLTFYGGLRKTFTDFIDDVSGSYANPNDFEENERIFVDNSITKGRADGTNEGLDRGINNTNDWYVITGFMLAVRLNYGKSACEAFR